MPDLRHTLNSGRVLIMDGAMGTELQRAGIGSGECYEAWNLSHPERVRAIHRSYLEAGAACLLTNTFQANHIALARFGLDQRLEDINRAAVELARSAGDQGHYVLASIGPVDLRNGTEPLDATIRSLMETDGLLLETWSNQFEVAAARATDPSVNVRGLPVLLALAFDVPDGSDAQPRLLGCGLTPGEVVTRVARLGLVVIGANCGRNIDLERMIGIAKSFRAATNLPLLVRPNAGTPRMEQGRWVYPCSPKEVAGKVTELVARGVRLVGGCCGTTPEHIRAMAAALQEMKE